MNAIVLAKGKKSERIGLDKAFIEVKGKKLVEIVLKKVKPLFERIYIVSLRPEKFMVYEDEKVKILKDEIRCGPLGGIYIGLVNSNTSYNFVFAIDMPFLNVDFIKYMMKRKRDYDLLVPVYHKNPEVLHAIYRKEMIYIIEKHLNEKDYRVKDILKKVETKYIEENEIEKMCKPEIAFFNLNNKDDLKFLIKTSNAINMLNEMLQ